MTWDETTLFENVIIAVTCTGQAILISGPEDLINYMDGFMFDDNAHPDTLEKYPEGHGVYVCNIAYHFKQGYYGGYPHNGESDWDYVPQNIRPISFVDGATNWSDKWPTEPGVYWFYGFTSVHEVKRYLPETHFVTVKREANGLFFYTYGLFFYTHAQFIYDGDAVGLWQKVDVPEPPKDVWDKFIGGNNE